MMYELTHLPKPSSQEIQHSQLLVENILAQIQQTGPLRFDQYMQQILYAPGLGYYRSHLEKFGRAGDFVTAPMISPLFSQCLSAQLIEILSGLSQKNIIEFGGGNGLMATQILQTLEKQSHLPDHYYIVELSAELSARQRQTISENLPHLIHKVSWLNNLENVTLEGVIIANEVLDAMPVHIFRTQEQNNFQELFVDWQEDQFTPHWGDISESLKKYLTQTHIEFPSHYQSEANLWISPWLKTLEQLLTKGAILLIDYGFSRKEFYHPDRSQGTLMCHYQHHAHSDPFILPGLQDITSHVDFTQVAEVASQLDLQVAGYTTQANFLLACGISEMVQKSDETQTWETSQQLKKLLFPTEMGEIFKVIALTKGLEMSLLGFMQFDRRDYL